MEKTEFKNKIKGIDLCREYYEQLGRPMLEQQFPDIIDRIAVGLVGHGSECFGFDDDVSRDHDFAPGFCLWLTDEDEQKFGFRLFRAYSKLPSEYKGISMREKSMGADGKGVYTISEFYRRYTGRDGAPETIHDWLYTPSYAFAEATNGEVFTDPLGRFSEIRQQILHGMPDDVRLKKISSSLFTLAQSGQYNYLRCEGRGERVAAQLALARFTEEYANLVCLLNSVHAPYYKWLHRTARSLPVLGAEVARLGELAPLSVSDPKSCLSLIDVLCRAVSDEIVRRGLSAPLGDYLEPYAYAVNENIKTESLRNMPIML